VPELRASRYATPAFRATCGFDCQPAEISQDSVAAQLAPMTSVSRAASTTSLVTVESWLISTSPVIWAKDAVDESKAAARDPRDGGDRFGVSEVVRGEGEAEPFPRVPPTRRSRLDE
jgi:hypothetical protein